MSLPYQLLQAIEPQRARFRFNGPFEGREICWDAELLTLAHYYEQGLHQGRYQAGEVVELQQFIDIAQGELEPRPIVIVHAIQQVDAASVLKTIIMIRNYKRLQRGVHGYGEFYRFAG